MPPASAVSLAVLQQRSSAEKISKRRNKLRENIVSRVVQRYHAGRPGLSRLTPEQTDSLRSDVDQLIEQGTVTDNEVTRLAAKLRRTAVLQNEPARSESAPIPDGPTFNELPPIDPPSRPESRANPPMMHPGGVQGATCASTISSLARPNTKLARSAKPGVIRRRENLVCDEPWNRIIQEDMLKFADEQKQHQEKVQHKILGCKAALDKQVDEIQQIKGRERDDATRFASEENNRRMRWTEDEKRRQHERQKTAVKDRVHRDEQLIEERRLRREELDREKDEEHEYRRQLQSEVKAEADAEATKRRHYLTEYRQFMDFNKAEQQRKRDLQQRERDQDKEMLAAHAALLERQERQRGSELAKFQEKQAAKVDTYHKMFAAEQARTHEDEIRREREMQLIAKKQRDEESKRDEKQRAGKLAFTRTLDQQLRAKQDEKKKELVEQREFRALQETEVRASIAFDLEQRSRRRQAAKQHLGELNSQVAEKHEKNMKDIQVGIARQVDLDHLLPKSMRRGAPSPLIQ